MTAVTTDTATAQKVTTVNCTHIEGLPWFTYVMELMIEILKKRLKKVFKR